MRQKKPHGGEFHHKHSLGQNFIEDEALLEQLAELSLVTQEDCVLEIGPGFGALTNGLRHPELYSHIAALSSALIKERILRAKEGPLTDQDYAANDYFNRTAYETMFDLDSIQDFENSELCK